MNKAMNKSVKVVETFSDFFGFLSGTVLVLAAVVTTYDVLGRTLFGSHAMWAIEVSQYSLLFASFMGAGYALKEKAYICVDFVVEVLPEKVKAPLAFAACLLSSATFFFLSQLSFKMTIQYYQKGWTTSTPMQVKIYLLIGIVALGTGFLALQQLVELFKSKRASKGESEHDTQL